MLASYIRCRVAHFKSNIASPINAFEYIDDAIVILCGQKVETIIPAAQAEAHGIKDHQIKDRRPALMLPGFIDAHVHAPQFNMIASYGEKLLDWLQKYTFPEELKFLDQEYAQAQAERFIDSLLAHGTTSAFIFTTSFKHSTQAIFETALDRNMRLVAGKVLMDRNAPEQLLDSNAGIEESRNLIQDYHGRGRLGYAITPRFSGTSTAAQLKAAGKLLAEVPDLWMQTHLSENMQEVQWTKSLFPEAKDYLHTYELHGLHTEKSIYAHCIYLSEDELKRLADSGSTIAFCPSSNLFLGSGLLDIDRIHRMNAKYCIASDVGAGTSLSILKTLGDAYKVCQLNSYSLSAYEAFYAATLGAAKHLKLDKHIGNLEPGKEADFIFINSSLDPIIDERLKHTNTIEEELFVYMIMADERIVESTHVAGNMIYTNPRAEQGSWH